MIDSQIRATVSERASHSCEYCLLPRKHHCWPFHVEHIVPKQHGGDNSLSNLALACPHWNRYKSTNLTAVDPETGRITPLFDPRNQA